LSGLAELAGALGGPCRQRLRVRVLGIYLQRVAELEACLLEIALRQQLLAATQEARLALLGAGAADQQRSQSRTQQRAIQMADHCSNFLTALRRFNRADP
jgi:hypothetical protein